MAVQVASLFGVLSLDTADYDRKLVNARRDADTFAEALGDKFHRAGLVLEGIGGSISTLVAPLKGFANESIGASMDFESAFANVRKTVDASEEELAILKQGLQDFAISDSPIAGLDKSLLTLTEVMAAAGQLGIANEDLMSFSETMAYLGVATDMTAEEAAVFSARFANVTGMDMKNISNFADVLVTLGNNFAATESEIAAFASRLAPLAGYGFGEDVILGWSAGLASLGITAELGGTNVNKTMAMISTAVASGGKKLEKFAAIAGYTGEQFSQFSASGQFMQFLYGLRELEASDQILALNDLGIKSTEQQTLLMRLAAGWETLSEAEDMAYWAMAGNNAALDEATAKANTTEGRVNRLKNRLFQLKVTVGDALKPALDNLLETFIPIIGSVTDWAAANPELIAQIGMLVAGLAGGGSTLVSVGMGLKTIGALITGIGGVVSAPIALIIGAVAALAAAYHTNFGGIRDFIDAEILPLFQRFFGYLAEAWDMVRPVLETIYSWFVETALPAISSFIENKVLPLFQSFFGFIGDIWGIIGPVLGQVYAWFVEKALPEIFRFVENTVGPAIEGLFNFIAGAWELIRPSLTDVFRWFVEDALPKIASVIENDVAPVIQGIFDYLSGIWALISPELSKVYDWFVKNGLPFIQSVIEGATGAVQSLIGIFQVIWERVQPALETFKTKVAEIFGWLKDNVITPFENLINGVIESIETLRGVGQLANGQMDYSPYQYEPTAAEKRRDPLAGSYGLGGAGNRHRAGLESVPHDDYPALLHKDERVLTADENREYRAGNSGIGISIQSLAIYANTAAEGAAAADGFEQRLNAIHRAKGIR